MTAFPMRVAVGLMFASAALAVAAEPAPPPRLVERTPADEQARAYRALFEKVGRSGLPELTKSKDTSLALQASWELHKKLVKRADIPGASKLRDFDPTDTYDPAEIQKFLTVFKDRTKAPAPEWWAKAISYLAVRKGDFHAVVEIDRTREDLHEVKTGETVRRVRKGVTLTQGEGKYTYKSREISFEVPKSKWPMDFEDCLADVNGEKITCLAPYSSTFAFPFQITAFENKGGKRIWIDEVWALRKQAHIGPSAEHRVELTLKGDTVFVFGSEGWGLYVEGFDIVTGKCRFRFCTSDWHKFSEQWDIK